MFFNVVLPNDYTIFEYRMVHYNLSNHYNHIFINNQVIYANMRDTGISYSLIHNNNIGTVAFYMLVKTIIKCSQQRNT